MYCNICGVSVMQGKLEEHLEGAIHQYHIRKMFQEKQELPDRNCQVCHYYYPDTIEGLISHLHSKEHTDALWANSILQKSKWPFPSFGTVTVCPKCDHSLTSVKPITIYNSFTNLMKRTCHFCKYQWDELCADGSEPKNVTF